MVFLDCFSASILASYSARISPKRGSVFSLSQVFAVRISSNPSTRPVSSTRTALYFSQAASNLGLTSLRFLFNSSSQIEMFLMGTAKGNAASNSSRSFTNFFSSGPESTSFSSECTTSLLVSFHANKNTRKLEHPSNNQSYRRNVLETVFKLFRVKLALHLELELVLLFSELSDLILDLIVSGLGIVEFLLQRRLDFLLLVELLAERLRFRVAFLLVLLRFQDEFFDDFFLQEHTQTINQLDIYAEVEFDFSLNGSENLSNA